MFSAMRLLWWIGEAGGAGQKRIIATALLLACALGLSACSAVRLGYAQAPELIHWWADGYLDFDAEQSAAVREASRRWLAWHRSQQLPEVSAQLKAVGQAWRGDRLSAQQVCQWSGQVRRWVDAGLAQALPDLAQLATQLTPAQLQHLAERQAQRRREQAEEWQALSPAQQRDKAVERLGERYERLMGPLNAPQRQWLAETVAVTDDPARWAAEQRRRQDDLLGTLQGIVQSRDTPAAAQARLQALAQRWRAGPPPTQAWLQANEQAHCALLARLHGSASPRQREAGIEQLAAWEGDARALVLSATAAAPAAALATAP